jgi:hypothetical protein
MVSSSPSPSYFGTRLSDKLRRGDDVNLSLAVAVRIVEGSKIAEPLEEADQRDS